MAIYVKDTFTGTPGTDLTAHTGETGATWTGHPFTATYTPHIVIAGTGSSGKGIHAASDNYFAFVLASGDPGTVETLQGLHAPRPSSDASPCREEGSGA